MSPNRRSPAASRFISALTALVAVTSGSPRYAHATPSFPAAVQSYVGAAAAPHCVVCHTTEAGGTGTVTTPFGVYMTSRGLAAYDVNSLQFALSAAKSEMHDTNGDGIDDFDALAQGLNPNAPSDGPMSTLSPPAYGCSESCAPAGGVGSTAPCIVSLSALAFIVVRRSRHRLLSLWAGHGGRSV